MANTLTRLLKLGALYAAAQQGFAFAYLASRNVRQTLASEQNTAPRGVIYEHTERYDAYTVTRRIEDGIERVTYTPHERKFDTPIIMQHGMWHGAWCWDGWQALLATWGWESHAHSLPGHAGSLPQKPIWLCTLDYYLSFLVDEINRMPVKPVLMGHSMGGALAQWVLKYVTDDLPATVLVAPWTAYSTFADGIWPMVKRDPLVVPLSMLSWSAGHWVRNPQRAAEALITESARLSPQELAAHLSNESILAVYQHNPPFWSPPQHVQTPMLLLSGQRDALVTLNGHKRMAKLYHADHQIIADSGHNLMTEASYQQTAQIIHDWLVDDRVN